MIQSIKFQVMINENNSPVESFHDIIMCPTMYDIFILYSMCPYSPIKRTGTDQSPPSRYNTGTDENVFRVPSAITES